MHWLSSGSLRRFIPKGTWALVEDGISSSEGQANIFSSSGSPFFVVNTCSPQHRYLNYMNNKIGSETYYMLPFSVERVNAMVSVLQCWIEVFLT